MSQAWAQVEREEAGRKLKRMHEILDSQGKQGEKKNSKKMTRRSAADSAFKL